MFNGQLIYGGIDIGSITAKAALIRDNKILGSHIIPTGVNHLRAGEMVFDALLNKLNISRREVSTVVSTGYGRASVAFADKALTEIVCHGAGVHFSSPEIQGVIDVGGQDSKSILINDNGQVIDFAMNDKCAAGTGRFLEVMANVLGIELNCLGDVSLTADTPAVISSICTVFAESEVISMIARHEKTENIIAGIHQSAASRVALLARKIKLSGPVIMTGGVARNKGMVAALSRNLSLPVTVGISPQENGAIGAAVLASQL